MPRGWERVMAHGYIKLSVNLGLEASLAEGLAIERAHQSQLFASEDVTEGLKAFQEAPPLSAATRGFTIAQSPLLTASMSFRWLAPCM